MSSCLGWNMKWSLPFPQAQNSTFEILNNVLNFFSSLVSIPLCFLSSFRWKRRVWKKRLKRGSSGLCYTENCESWPFTYLCQVFKTETILSALYDWVKKTCASKSGSTEITESRPAERVWVSLFILGKGHYMASWALQFSLFSHAWFE